MNRRRPLQLQRETIRHLGSDALRRVGGAGKVDASFECTILRCSSSNTTSDSNYFSCNLDGTNFCAPPPTSEV